MHVLKNVAGIINVIGVQEAWRYPNNSLWEERTVSGAWAFNQHSKPSWGLQSISNIFIGSRVILYLLWLKNIYLVVTQDGQGVAYALHVCVSHKFIY